MDESSLNDSIEAGRSPEVNSFFRIRSTSAFSMEGRDSLHTANLPFLGSPVPAPTPEQPESPISSSNLSVPDDEGMGGWDPLLMANLPFYESAVMTAIFHPVLAPTSDQPENPSIPTNSSAALHDGAIRDHYARLGFPLEYSEPPQEKVDIFNAVFYQRTQLLCLPERLLGDISWVLYESRVAENAAYLDIPLFLGCWNRERYISPAAYPSYLRCLIRFLGDGEGAKYVDGFLEVLRQNPEWISDNREMRKASCIFGYALDIGTDKPILDFKGHIKRLFPPHPWSRHPPSFTLSLADIQAVGLVVSPTSILEEHLEIKGNIVKILVMTPSRCKMLKGYESNRVATAVKLGTLGTEIFGSLKVLYGDETGGYAGASAIGLISDPLQNFYNIL